MLLVPEGKKALLSAVEYFEEDYVLISTSKVPDNTLYHLQHHQSKLMVKVPMQSALAQGRTPCYNCFIAGSPHPQPQALRIMRSAAAAMRGWED